MTESLKDQILSVLEAVMLPDNSKNIVRAGMVKAVAVDVQGRAIVTLQVNPDQGTEMEPLRQQAQDVLDKLSALTKVTVILTAEKAPPPQMVMGKSKSQSGGGVQHKVSSRPVAPQVKKIIAVASGKGGVGKSTVSVNLAASLSQQGLKVGLMDADIYGPSIPLMMGLSDDDKPALGKNDLVEPLTAHGIKVISIGFFVDAQAPLVWRGPMVHSAVQQFLRDVDWGELDVLVIDMPPGTGDIQLSVAQAARLSGAVVVSTPQDLALIDAKKAMGMFDRLDIPVLGLVENMSQHVCSNCGHTEPVFGHGGAAAEATRRRIPLLGELPLHMDMRLASDSGTPFVMAHPDHPATKIFADMAFDVAEKLVEDAA